MAVASSNGKHGPMRRFSRMFLAEVKMGAAAQPNEIGIIVKDGIVTLTGWVDSYTKRWRLKTRRMRSGREGGGRTTSRSVVDRRRENRSGHREGGRPRARVGRCSFRSTSSTLRCRRGGSR